MASDLVTYTVVVNQPGYLPDGDAQHASTLHEARTLAAETVRDSFGTFPDALAALTPLETDDALMGPYDIGPDGGTTSLPGPDGAILEIAPTW